MSTFETKTADNFIFDETADPREQDSLNTPFLRKNIAYVVDQQAGNGTYTSGEVIIDSQAISASGNFTDWRNGYIIVPKQTKVEFSTDATSASGNSIRLFRKIMEKRSVKEVVEWKIPWDNYYHYTIKA